MTTAAAHTRRVLGDMSVNTPIAGNTPHKTKKGLGVEGMEMSRHAQLMDRVASELKEKRVVATEGGSPAKRRRIESVAEGELRMSPHRETGRRSLSPVSSKSISPTSSFGNSTLEKLDDSQDTILTIPDDDQRLESFNAMPIVSPPAPLTAAQIRAKATSIRLRLTLASYKVRTNQIDVPISRLEIRSSTNTPSLPQLRWSSSNSNTTQRGNRTALPTAPTTSFPGPHSVTSSFSAPATSFTHPPSMALSHFQELAQKAVQAQEIRSSPPISRVASPAGGEQLATPILPRQRAGLLNPPVLEGIGEGDLPSSVVKGRAADGLLSLMRNGDGVM